MTSKSYADTMGPKVLPPVRCTPTLWAKTGVSTSKIYADIRYTMYLSGSNALEAQRTQPAPRRFGTDAEAMMRDICGRGGGRVHLIPTVTHDQPVYIAGALG